MSSDDAHLKRWLTGHEHGFTLLELMMVTTIVGILGTLAVPMYQQSILKARETALLRNLVTIREVIDQYRSDKGKFPDSMQDLVEREYLRTIPLDPFTRSRTTWQEMLDPSEPGISDVHSGSMLVGLNGTPYNQW